MHAREIVCSPPYTRLHERFEEFLQRTIRDEGELARSAHIHKSNDEIFDLVYLGGHEYDM